MEPRELVVVDDKREYTQEEIKDLVNMIDMGNRTRAGQRNNVGGVARVVSAFGIVGKIIKPHVSLYCILCDKYIYLLIVARISFWYLYEVCNFI